MPPLYDRIGVGYNTTRTADPYLADRFVELLDPVPTQTYLDVGCGTGNYVNALLKRGLHVWGVDPSSAMLTAARAQCLDTLLFQASAEHLPFRNATFAGATAILTTHHWTNLRSGLAEVRRVVRTNGRLVMFTFTPEQVRHYWLREYFPEMIAKAAMTAPPFPVLADALVQAGFTAVQAEPYHVREDLQDHFLYSHKYRPDAYLRAEVRAGASSFRTLATAVEVAEGLTRLATDILTGHITTVIKNAFQASETIGDYLFVRATAGSTT